MIVKSSVFILGAGASVPYGYPTGFELQERLKGYLRDVDRQPNAEQLLKLWDDLGFRLVHLKKFYEDFSHSATYSIDKFLERRPDHIELGKALIAFILKQKEEPHLLTINLNEINWYADLANRLDMAPDNVESLKLSFVTFNYDRSLECFLYNMLKHKTVDEGEALKAFNSIKIVHIYGGFNRFPWEEGGIPYDTSLTKDILVQFSKEIKIMSDERKTDELKKAYDLISKAHNVYFLGFGYDKNNLERLGFHYHQRTGQLVTGTSCGMRKSALDEARVHLQTEFADGDVSIMNFIDDIVRYE